MEKLKAFLDRKVAEYNQPGFIELDPICIPHRFSRKQDIEIMGFFAAILAWGQRKTIINKCTELVERMDGQPYDFIRHHQEADLKSLLGFKHRTFNDTDLLYFVYFFQQHYRQHNSLEDAFIPPALRNNEFREEYLTFESTDGVAVSSSSCYQSQLVQPPVSVESALNYFRAYFFHLEDAPARTRKHVSSPLQKSTCKRLNMFLRWMVRNDSAGVDFGLWRRLRPADLVCPCDVHVERVARHLQLIDRKQRDWTMAVELTERLRRFDPADPVKYDFALFGLGVEGKM